MAYGSCTRVLTGRKKPTAAALANGARAWSMEDEFMIHLIAFYRGRVEAVIARMKKHAWCHTPFRGEFLLFNAFFDVSTLMTALEINLEFQEDNKPMFEVVGPWRHVFYP